MTLNPRQMNFSEDSLKNIVKWAFRILGIRITVNCRNTSVLVRDNFGTVFRVAKPVEHSVKQKCRDIIREREDYIRNLSDALLKEETLDLKNLEFEFFPLVQN